MKTKLVLALLIIGSISWNYSWACHEVSLTETNAVDNGDGTYTYTFDVCVGIENTYGFYLTFTGANLVGFPADVTGPSTGNTINASVPPVSGLGTIEYGDFDDNTSPLFSDFNSDCVSMAFTFDNTITTASLDGTQFDHEPPTGCGTGPVPTTTCITPNYTVDITIDNWGFETDWEIVDQITGNPVANGGNYAANSNTVIEVCVADGCYDFVITDDWGDGICCASGIGGYTVSDATGIIAAGGDFGAGETVPLGCVLLPVELKSFEGRIHGSHVLLEWKVYAEIESAYYVVERRSEDGRWNSIGKVDCEGLSAYSLLDPQSMDGENYYRLFYVDFDGNSSELDVTVVQGAKNRFEVGRYNYLGQKVDDKYKGLVIIQYNDGSQLKTTQF